MQDLAVILARSCGTAPGFPEAILVKSCSHRRVLDSTMDNRMTTNAESIMEPDCAFYVGERANGYYAAREEGDAAVVAFVERTAPDLVVENEISSFDESKIARYGDLGVRELWRLHARKGSDELRVDFLVLRAGTAPRELDASVVLAGLTPDDVCEAVEKVRSSRTLAERTEAVSRIVLRRQRAIVRVREEEESYSASTGQPESARATGV